MVVRGRGKSTKFITFLTMIGIFSTYEIAKIIFTPSTTAYLNIAGRIAGPLSPRDEGLVSYVKEKYLKEPSNKMYNFRMDKNDKFSKKYTKFSRESSSPKHIFELLNVLFPKSENLEKGFYIEAGALDGEMGSNTLYLEKELGWMGLLVEPDIEMYNLLISKNRKAWTCHCCLSTKPYPFKTTLLKFSEAKGKESAPSAHFRGLNFIQDVGLFERLALGYVSYEPTECLPLETILLALNITEINFFSLDIEGSEVNVLHEFPWDKVMVDVWIIEHSIRNSNKIDEDFVQWFIGKGYDLLETTGFPVDYTFIRKGSDVYAKYLKNNNMTSVT